jgi:chromosome segregation ATPase
METKEQWKSPLRKLVRFFERSRDRWKEKYLALKHKCKLMANQLRAVERSRESWRQKAQQAQQELRRMQQELEQNKKAVAF